MSLESENVRRARELYETLNRGDLDAILAGLPEDFEFHPNARIPDFPSVFRGHQGMEALFRVWMTEPWQGSLQLEPAHVIDLGDDRVLALITFRGTGRGSGVPVELEYAQLAHFSEGIIRRVDGYTSWERALRAVGLDETPRSAGGG